MSPTRALMHLTPPRKQFESLARECNCVGYTYDKWIQPLGHFFAHVPTADLKGVRCPPTLVANQNGSFLWLYPCSARNL